MERLTGRNEKGDLLLMGEQAYAGDDYEAAVSALEGYEDAEEQGRLVRLPCKVGDTVYCICNNGHILTQTVTGFVFQNGEWKVAVYNINNHGYRNDHYISFEDFGKTAFFTCEEAKSALEEIEAALERYIEDE